MESIPPTNVDKPSGFSASISPTKVTIPLLGAVSMHPGHLSVIRQSQGGEVNFIGPNSFGEVYRKLLADVHDSREGSMAQTLAFFTKLRDYQDGCRTNESNYSEYAKVWEKYCSKQFFAKDSSSTMTPLGKSVSRSIFVGKASKGDNFRKNVSGSYPLHFSRCDICAFLDTLKKNQSRVKPFAALDMAGIHEYFVKHMVFESCVGTNSVDVDVEPHYEPHSPEVSDVEIFDPPEPVKEKRVVRKEEREVATAKRKLFKDSDVVKLVEGKPDSILTCASVHAKTHVPGELEW
jgi:hypothetical protein